ncbi:MAG: hypothetical protein RLO50_02115 [Azospirillaceae bacterium]
MISQPEFIVSAGGAWRLFRFDRTGLDRIDTSVEGAIRSYWLTLILAPLALFVGAVQWWPVLDRVAFLPLVIGEVSLYVIGWLMMPVMVDAAIRLAGLPDRLPQFIAGYNWGSVITMSIASVFIALTLLLDVPGQVAGLLSLLVIAMLLVYQAYVTHLTLEIPVIAAGVITLGDYFVTLTVHQAVQATLLQAALAG